MIEPKLKRALGQMVKGVQVVGAAHDGVVRAYTSHWVSQVAFEEPVYTKDGRGPFERATVLCRQLVPVEPTPES